MIVRTCAYHPAEARWIGPALADESRGATPARSILDRWDESDARPALILFYWGDPADSRAQAGKHLETGALDTEEFARASTVFQCFKVDAREVAPVELARRGVDVRRLPMFVLADAGGTRWEVVPGAKSASRLIQHLRSAFQTRFPEAWERVRRLAREHQVALEEAKLAAKRKDFARAMELVQPILASPIKTEALDGALELRRAVEPNLPAAGR